MTLSNIERTVGRWLHALLIDGPRDIAAGDRSFWDTIFTWPVRLLIVFGAGAVGYVWGKTPSGIQLGWGLQYGLFIAISIVASFWSVLLAVNAGLAGWWLYLTYVRLTPKVAVENQSAWDVLDVVTWLNRQVAHVEVFATYIAIALILTPRLFVQAPLLAAVLALGGPVIDGITQKIRWLDAAETRTSRSRLLTQRRFLIYILSFAGLLFLASRAPDQLSDFAPLLATALPGLTLRLFRFKARRAQERDPSKAPVAKDPATRTPVATRGPEGKVLDAAAAVKKNRNDRARLQQNAAPWIAPAFAVLVIGVAVILLVWQAERVAKAASDERDGPPASVDTCARESGGPVAPAAITMYVVADTQLHELGGRRFPGQMEVASTLVPVAHRPVELDVLSTAAVVRFAQAYDALWPRKAGGGGSRPWWAHLGDFADHSCTREMDRMIELLERHVGEGQERWAGVAPGNHDSAFTGNFEWSPYWSDACTDDDPVPGVKYARLDKVASDERLKKLLGEKNLAPGTITGVVEGSLLDGLWRASPNVWWSASARYTVTPLGGLPTDEKGKQRGVVGIFIDTADRLSRNFGIAGTFGTFSSKQAKAIQEAVTTLKNRPPSKTDSGKESGNNAGKDAVIDYADPWYVVFGHSPYQELTDSSREALDGLFSWLDRKGECKAGGDLCKGPRILAFVAAHTHHAEAHRHCVNGRLLREIVVGSVIDAPQQAAQLEIGTDSRGRASVRLTTLPAVRRGGLTCEPQFGVSAGDCHRVVAPLHSAKDCIDLVDGPDSGDEAPRSCEELERPLSLDEQVAGLVRHGGPRDPEKIMDADTKRARALLSCLCRRDPSNGITPPRACKDQDLRDQPLHAERYAKVVEELATDQGRANEVTCLAWAASSVQEHKANGMTMADALRCAFDDPSAPSARVIVATSEDVACQ